MSLEEFMDDSVQFKLNSSNKSSISYLRSVYCTALLLRMELAVLDSGHMFACDRGFICGLFSTFKIKFFCIVISSREGLFILRTLPIGACSFQALLLYPAWDLQLWRSPALHIPFCSTLHREVISRVRLCNVGWTRLLWVSRQMQKYAAPHSKRN